MLESVQSHSASTAMSRLHGIQHGKLYKSSSVAAPNSTIPTKYQTVIVSNADRSGFASSSKRFQYEMDENLHPGPGAYRGIDEFVNATPSQSLRGVGGLASKTRRNIQFGGTTATSNAQIVTIPSYLNSKKDFNQSNVSRNFQPNIAVQREKANNHPAPNRYNLSDFRPRNQPLVDAGFAFKSKTKRELLANHDAMSFPGPSQYDRMKADKLVLMDTSQGISSSFKSKSQRKLLLPNSNVPGPNAYNPFDAKQRDSADKKKNNRQHYLCLSAPALPLPPTPPSPGPGQYNMVEYERPKHFMSSAVFLSNASRWTHNSKDFSPGPAQYQPTKPAKQHFIYNTGGKWI